MTPRRIAYATASASSGENASRAGVERVAHSTEAQVDHAGVLVDGPADRTRLGFQRDDAVGANDLGDEQLRGERHPGDSLAVAEGRGNQAGDEGAVAMEVLKRGTADEALLLRDPSEELWVRSVDPGVDDGDAHPRQRRALRPGIESLHCTDVPLASEQREARGECHAPPSDAEALHIGDPGDLHDAGGALRFEHDGERSKRLDLAARPGLERRCEPGTIRARSDTDREARGVGGARQRKCHEYGRNGASQPFTTRVWLVPATRPRPG